MGALIDPAARARLIGVLSRMSSDFDGERAAAGLLATRLMKAYGLTWDDLLPAPPAIPTQAGYVDYGELHADLSLCQRHTSDLSDWEMNFVRSVSGRRRLSEKQVAVIQRVASALRERGCA